MKWLIAAMLLACVTACGGDKTSDATTDSEASADTTDGAGAAGAQCVDCAKDSDCGAGLTCDKPAFVCKTPNQVKIGAPVCDIDCFESDYCKDDGLCTIKGKVCLAKTLAHCVASKNCHEKGRCTPETGECVLKTDSDCKNSSLCANEGLCTFKAGACVKTDGVKCGDGKCEGNETKQTCAKDCGPVGGDPCPCQADACGVSPGCPNDCGGCLAGKKCFANVCTEAKCKIPATWPQNVQRVTKLTMLNHKSGCDLDDSGKVNNMLGKLLTVYPKVNGFTLDALTTFSLNLLMSSSDYASNGKPFSISLLDAKLDPAAAGKCEPTFGPCKFVINAHSYDLLAKTGQCPAQTKVAGAKVNANKLTAGGPSNSLQLAVYVAGVPLVAKLQHVTMTGIVSGGSEWQTTTSGRLCGAITATDIKKAVDTLPESALKGTAFDKKKVNELIDGLFMPDIDLDGDGNFDAMSAAWAFETGQAIAIGVK